MAELDLLLRKEDISEEAIKGHVAVVFDILLATSTVAAMFHHGAKEIMPVLNSEEGLKKAREQLDDQPVLVGEYRGQAIEGYLEPFPTRLKEKLKGKKVVFTTTNGTVALKNSWPAEAVYAGSMLNEEALADYLVHTYRDQSIMLICSGSSGRFNLEDFFGAGSFAQALIARGKKQGLQWQMSDAALAAYHFYKAHEKEGEELLKKCRVGHNLTTAGYVHEVMYILEKNACPVIPQLEGDVLKTVAKVDPSQTSII